MASKGGNVRVLNRMPGAFARGGSSVEKYFRDGTRIDELLEQAGDTSWQREMRELCARMDNDYLSAEEMEELRELLLRQKRLDDGNEERWGEFGGQDGHQLKIIEALGMVEQELGFGLEGGGE